MLSVSEGDHRLEPKGKGSRIGVPISPIADVVPPANRRDLNHAVDAVTELGKPVVFPQGKRAARDADRAAGRGWRKKRKPVSNRPDRGCGNNITPRESGQTSAGSLFTRKLDKPSKRESR